MGSENELELYRQHRASQQKYAYFLLAAVGACIGFALTQTKGLPIQQNQLPLGLAILFWSLSFWCGCEHLQRSELTMYANMGLIRLQQGRDSLAGRNPNLIQLGVETVREVIDKHGSSSARAVRWQFRFLVFGVISYVAWHILDMWARTLPSSPIG